MLGRGRAPVAHPDSMITGSWRLGETRYLAGGSVFGLVGCDDAFGNATPVTDLVSVLARPFPDVSIPLPVPPGPGPATAAAAPDAPGVMGKSADLLAEILAMRRAQVDLKNASVDGKCYGLRPLDVFVVG